RDGLEATRASLRTREAPPGEAAGTEAVRAWACAGLERVTAVSFDAEKPVMRRAAAGELSLEGRALFIVYGFRADGARVERSAPVTLRIANADAALVEGGVPRYTLLLGAV